MSPNLEPFLEENTTTDSSMINFLDKVSKSTAKFMTRSFASYLVYV